MDRTRLYHLYRSEQRDVRYWAERWPTLEQAPFWQTRRAAVLAEIGDVLEAKRLADDALLRIRSLLRVDEENIVLLSQEGWTMLLLDTLRTDALVASDVFHGRWDQLARYRCNAWLEVEGLRSAVQLAVPRKSGTKEKYVDPFTLSPRESRRFGGRSDAIRAGFSMILQMEEAGVPLRCGQAVVYLKEAVAAARLTAPSAFVFATDVILRAADPESAFEWFDLVRLATLPDATVARYVGVLQSSILQALDRLASHPDQHNESFSTRQLTVKLELLSRFAFRMSPDAVSSILMSALEWCKLPSVQQNDWGYRHMDHLLTRLLAYADVDTWARILPDLLRFPLPDSGEANTRIHEWWPEPLTHAEIPAAIRYVSSYNDAAVLSAADRLILVARDGSPAARSRALIRLFAMHNARLLNDDQSKLYGAALWARVSPETGLPLDMHVYPFVLLRLPAPEAGLPEQTIRTYLSSSEFPGAITRIRWEDGREGIQTSLGRDSQELLVTWFVCTRAEDPDERDDFGLGWSEAEVKRLLILLENWWDDQQAFASTADTNDYRETLHVEFGNVHSLLRRTVIPSVEGDAPSEDRVVRLITEFEQMNVRVLPVLPHMLRLNQSRFTRPQIAESVRVALRSDDEDQVKDAAEATYRWIVAAEQERLPDPPRDLLSELILRFRIQRRVGLTHVMVGLCNVVRYAPLALESSFLDDVAVGLERLLSETKLPDEEDRPVSDMRSPEYQEMLLLPGLRRHGARLASECRRQIELEVILPSPKLLAAVESWALALQTEVLPDVLRAWDHGLKENDRTH